jgi:hypothetical protein
MERTPTKERPDDTARMLSARQAEFNDAEAELWKIAGEAQIDELYPLPESGVVENLDAKLQFWQSYLPTMVESREEWAKRVSMPEEDASRYVEDLREKVRELNAAYIRLRAVAEQASGLFAELDGKLTEEVNWETAARDALENDDTCNKIAVLLEAMGGQAADGSDLSRRIDVLADARNRLDDEGEFLRPLRITITTSAEEQRPVASDEVMRRVAENIADTLEVPLGALQDVPLTEYARERLLRFHRIIEASQHAAPDVKARIYTRLSADFQHLLAYETHSL